MKNDKDLLGSGNQCRLNVIPNTEKILTGPQIEKS